MEKDFSREKKEKIEEGKFLLGKMPREQQRQQFLLHTTGIKLRYSLSRGVIVPSTLTIDKYLFFF